jgi:hypothetical protein
MSSVRAPRTERRDLLAKPAASLVQLNSDLAGREELGLGHARVKLVQKANNNTCESGCADGVPFSAIFRANLVLIGFACEKQLKVREYMKKIRPL